MKYIVHVPSGMLAEVKQTFKDARFFSEIDKVAYFQSHAVTTVEVIEVAS